MIKEQQQQKDIFALLGVERNTSENLSSSITTPSIPSVGRFEQLLSMIEKKKIDLLKAETKLKEMIAALSGIEKVESEIEEILGAPLVNKKKKIYVGGNNGRMILNSQTASLLAYIQKEVYVKVADLAKIAKVKSEKIRVWIWNALNGRKEPYIAVDTVRDEIYLTDEGHMYLECCKKNNFTYPELSGGGGLPKYASIGDSILNLLNQEKMTIAEVTKKLGLSKQRVSNWMYGAACGEKATVARNADGQYCLTLRGKNRLEKKK